MTRKRGLKFFARLTQGRIRASI